MDIQKIYSLEYPGTLEALLITGFCQSRL